jgi:hypothetical protein
MDSGRLHHACERVDAYAVSLCESIEERKFTKMNKALSDLAERIFFVGDKIDPAQVIDSRRSRSFLEARILLTEVPQDL